MKGVVFNVVEEVVTEQLSVAAWDAILQAAEADGAYTALGTYPDEELLRIVSAAGRITGMSDNEVLRFVGIHGFRGLADRVPDVMRGMRHWVDVLVDLDRIIHAEVRMLYPDAIVPGFVTTLQPDGVLLRYSSQRSMCALAEGLAVGAGKWFGRELVVDHVTCSLRGDIDCTLLVREAADR